MPSIGSRMYENHIPSFMSVYDMDSTMIGKPNLVASSTKLSSGTPYVSQRQQHRMLQSESDNESTHTQILSHHPRESTSTQASDSTDSSPTTTISTADSSSLSDPSPSSSPESPINVVPLSSFTASSFGLETFHNLQMAESNTIRLPLSDERPMTSPTPRKPKNPKSLALNLSPSTENFQISEPSSPSFIKPPTLMAKRKPSLLSLNTGAANKLSLSVEPPLGSPSVPSMLQRRGLKHSVSTPQMLVTPGFGPSGGMTLGDRNPQRSFGGLRLTETNTFTIAEDGDHVPPAGVQMATRVPGVTVGGDSFDRPHSGEDAKSPSYPEGPILMHEPSVHLYLEPKLEEAMQFDVIINVAREVKNPFKALEKDERVNLSQPLSKDSAPDPDTTIPDTAASLASFKTAFEVPRSGSTESSPTTPKPAAEKTLPEYIHVPWDHNTDVKDELWDLCQLIESRVNSGKKVLVHCQQGASRSATLIIAYGMYINQDLGPNEAYSLAQSKSRWVNPNMSLLFSLNDFKKVIDRKKTEKTTAARKTPSKHRPSLSAQMSEPPLTPSRARGNSTPSISARDNALNSRATHEDERPSPRLSDSAIERLADFDFGFTTSPSNPNLQNPPQHAPPPPPQHAPPPPPSAPPSTLPPTIIPFIRPADDDWEELLSPRITEMTANPLQDAFLSRSCIGASGSEGGDVPPTPGLFSPRVFEFPRSSFFPPPALPLVRNSLAIEEDPRSPPMKGEVPITRSIDDVL